MLQTTIIGYPRIGSLRELKFWTEDFIKGNISAEQLEKYAAKLRKEQWLFQKNNGLDLIPSGDFSFYDNMLDTAWMLNVIPAQYQKLGLAKLDTYFAMARGYQGEKGDVKALTMKKWFNTNYHYIVPILDRQTDIKLNSRRPVEEYTEAIHQRVKTKPVVIGPFTFLMLSQYRDDKRPHDYIISISEAYRGLLKELRNNSVEWLQVDEPYLVTDLNEESKQLFMELYSKILPYKGNLKVVLQTYFGDIRDIYQEICQMGFDGIGLDFLEGARNIDLIQNYSFPKDTYLFAGVVNGKNIWKTNYETTLKLLNRLAETVDRDYIVINTSCSLLHVPYTLDHEHKMDEQYKRHLAFAQEKLVELREIKELFIDVGYKNNSAYLNNRSIIKIKLSHEEKVLKQKINALTDADFARKPNFGERFRLQNESLRLPVLPTTTIGSFPQTREVKLLRSKLKKGEITKEQYESEIREKIARCIAMQEEIGLDVLVHGEYERNDMVEYFGEHLSGFLFTERAWVQSYGTRCVKPPIIWGDIKREYPFTLQYITYAQSLTTKHVKGMLTGPVTILNWSFPREDVPKRETALQLALAIREEVLDLEANGINIIQVDEAALKEKLPIRRSDWHTEYLDWAIKSFRLVHSGVRPTTQIHTHMCYSEFEEIAKEIDAMDADVISFEAARSNLSIVDRLKEIQFQTAVGPGVYDIHSPRVPSVEELTEALVRIINKLPIEKVWINPDCGLKTRGEKETIQSLRNMAAAVKEYRVSRR